jgi:hypothetical protein
MKSIRIVSILSLLVIMSMLLTACPAPARRLPRRWSRRS